MEKSTRGDTESSDEFEFDESVIDNLVSISYNSIMTEIKEDETTSTTPTTRQSTISRRQSTARNDDDGVNQTLLHQEDEDLQVSDDMDDVSSEPLFMLDCVGDKNLKSRYQEEEDPESESKVESHTSGDESRTSTVALPSWSNDGDDEKSQETTQLKKVNKEKRNSKYSFSTSIDPHLDRLLPKAKSSVDKVLETTKPADPTSETISERRKKKMNKERRNKVCSDKWFNMKAPEMTKDVKNQLSILQLREILDRKNFYKNNDRKKFPKFFQMGKVVESAADFYHARIPKKQRKATLLDEVMADADMKKYQKRKYAEIFGDAKKTKNKKKRKLVSK